MRAVLGLLFLTWVGCVHADPESADLLSAGELSTASMTELESRKAQVEEANDALSALLEGVTAGAAPAQPSKPVSQARSSEPRAEEPGVAQIPEGTTQTPEGAGFAGIRQQQALLPVAQAQVLVAQFLHKHPSHREARLTLARLQVLDNQPEAALRTLDNLVSSVASRDHPDWQPWFWAGTAYLALDEIASARRMLDVAVAKEGQVADIWLQLAVLEQELNNHAAALQYIGIAEQVDGQGAQVHLNRAYSLERLGQYDAALSAYRQFMSSRMSPGTQALRPSVMRRMALLAEHQQALEQSSDQSS
ncbi:MAG: tetratricopeptide repeat protein [bacterium]